MASPDSEHRQVEVVLDAEAKEEPRLLVGPREPQPRPPRRRERGHVLAEQLDGARGRPKVAGDDVEERGLPGPVRPQDRATLAGTNFQVDVLDGVKPAEAPADPPQAEGRRNAFGMYRRFGCWLRHYYAMATT